MKSLNGTLLRMPGEWSFFLLAALIAGACANPPLARAQSDCKAMFDASDKLTEVPHHGYSTQVTPLTNGQQKSVEGENIFAGGAYYVKIRGAWRKSPMTVQERKEQEQENRKEAKNVSCRHLRDEAVNGEAAAVYSAHAETEGLKSDATVWISKSKGLVLREEEDLDSDGEKSHVSARYEYGNVSAPDVSH